MRVGFFIIVMCFVLYKMRDDPIWGTLMGVFVYFAIPSREFYMPTLPYQAAFFMAGTALSIRTRDVYNEWVKGQVRSESHLAAAAIYGALRAEFIERISKGVLEGRDRDSVRRDALALLPLRFAELRSVHVPARLESIVRPLLDARLDLAATVGVKEAERMLAIHAGAPPRNFLPTMIERVGAAIDASTEEGFEQDLDKHLAKADEAHERAVRTMANAGTGYLGIPLPRGGVYAVLSNSGVWFHLAFTLATAYTAQTARYSVELASAQVEVCILLLIPLVSIMATVRTAEHFRLFLWAWTLGVLLLCYNGVTLWLAYGGRADNVGGQANDANWLGIIAVSVAPIGISMFTGERSALIRFAGLGAAGAAALGVIAGGSRGALIALIMGLAYWLVWTNKKGVAVALLLTGAAGFLVVAPDDFWERMSSMFLPPENNPWIMKQHESSAESRKRFWALARELFKELPWTGIGPMNYPKEVGVRGIMIEFGAGSREMAAHSTWFHLIAEYGIWGFIWIFAHLNSFFCLFRAMLIARKLKDDRHYYWLHSYFIGLQSGWIAAWLAMSFVSSQWYDFNYWIYIVGPVALQVARHTVAYKEWFQLPLPTTELPPPRYGPARTGELDLGSIDVSSEPVLRPR